MLSVARAGGKVSTAPFDKSPHDTTAAENYTGADKVASQDTWVIRRTCKISYQTVNTLINFTILCIVC